MPPKSKTSSKAEAEAPAKNKSKTIPSKRKADSTAEDSRKSSRRSSKPSPSAVLHFLLKDSSVPLTRPEQETTALKGNPSLRTYSSTPALTPFECLIAACLISRPISHALGMRALRTLLNAPYSLTTPDAIKDAGEERLHQALLDARTQHKAKTATQLYGLAEHCIASFTKGKNDAQLTKLHTVLQERDVDGLREELKKIKGIGDVGVGIFLRRVQATWDEIGPYVDDRTYTALKELGLPGEGDELMELLDKEWKNLDWKGIVETKNEAEAKKLIFVLVLERALGAELEGNVDTVLKTVAKG